jgi:glutaredoxin
VSQIHPAQPVAVTLVTSPACHYCDDAHSALGHLATQYELAVTEVSIESQEGKSLTATHRPMMSPLVLIDGDFFSAGRLPRRKLTKLLETRGARLASVEGAR